MTTPPDDERPEIPPRLPPGTLGSVAMTALLIQGLAALGVVWTAVVLERTQHYAAARGLLVGHALGQAVTLSWLLGVFLTFQRSAKELFAATTALWPARMVLLVVALALASAGIRLDPLTMFLTLMATYLLGLGVETWTLFKLQALAEPEGPAPADENA